MDFVVGVIKFCFVVLIIVLSYLVIKTAVVFLAIILAVVVTIGVAYLIYVEVEKSKHEPEE